MISTGGDFEKAGPIVQDALAAWATDVAAGVRPMVDEIRPDAIVTSLFGVEPVAGLESRCPWGVINSTFYIGPDPPRPMELDFGPRAIPLLRRYASLLGSADIVIHATDQVFDLSFERLPPTHHYSGPLGIWEPPANDPSYLNEPGDPWVLVSISSQLQDDIPLAHAALEALSDRDVRVLLTVGPDHSPQEISVRPENARIERTVSHAAVLRNGVALVSHAGHGSVMKALWEGKPMVLMPWGRDQPGVAARAENLGIALVVQKSDDASESLRAAISEALASADMKSAAETHAARLRGTDPPAQAAALLSSLL
jgi:UDP:flavonoid glycosyltransferase YjiC (YdhE family)